MFEAARAKALPVAYLEYQGEQHGFRQAKNTKRSLDAELYFYSKVFKFELAEPVKPVVDEAVLTVSIQDNVGHTTTIVRTFAPVVLDNRLLLPIIRR